MSFTSLRFAAFVALTAVVYFALPRRKRWTALLGASLVFYACAGARYLIFLLSTTATTYLTAIATAHMREKQDLFLAVNRLEGNEKKRYRAKEKRRRYCLLSACLLINFGALFVLKYLNAAVGLFYPSFEGFGFILPLGISFYTFQSAEYVIDVYLGKYPPERSFPKYALFIAFFPQLVQGPIGRFNITAPSLFNGCDWDPKRARFALERILWGCFKKLVVADRIAAAVNALTGTAVEYRGAMVVAGMLFYAARLYCDFSGGIDIAIGVGQLFGTVMSENFERPFFSKSIAEYWRRWHITLGTWFKDYTFYPLSTCKPMMRITKLCGKAFGEKAARRFSVYASTVILWMATGIWHGAGWNFIVWGLCNCFFILLSQELTPFYTRFQRKFSVLCSSWIWKCFRVIRTFSLMCFLRSFDCYISVPETFRAWASIITDFSAYRLFDGTLGRLGLDVADYTLLLLSVALIFIVSMLQRGGSVRELIESRGTAFSYAVIILLVVVTVIFGAYGTGYDSNQFIYSRF